MSSSTLAKVRLPKRFQIGTIVSPDSNDRFYLTEDQLSAHACVIGQTGSGKSKFLEHLMRCLMATGKGFALIDPHGDLSEDLLAYAAWRRVARNDSQFLSRVHYLEPSYEQVFHYDPFAFRPSQPIPTHLRADAVRAWLHAKADRIGEIVQRKQGAINFEGMARLQRVLTDVLIAVGTPLDGDGRHLPLSDALVLLDLEHPRHRDVFDLVAPHLPPEIQSEFRRFHSYRNPHQLLHEVESTINRLRSLLSPLVKSIFAEHVHTLDFRSMIRNGEILLVNLRETDYFSADQASAIGGLFIHELLSCAQNTPREERRQFFTIIDEAGEFIGADIQRALGVMRKFMMPLVLAAQDLSSFQKGTLDLRPKVLSQCGTIVSFRQSWPDDLDLLVRVMGTGNLDFTEMVREVERDDGHDFHWIDEPTRSFTEQDTWSESVGLNETRTESTQQTDGNSSQTNSSSSRSRHSSRGGTNTSTPFGREISKARSDQSGDGTAESSGSSSGHSTSTMNGESNARGTTSSKSGGGSTGRGLSISRKLLVLSRKRLVKERTGQLERQVSDQIEAMKQTLHSLNSREAIAKLRSENEAFVFRTANVDEKWLLQDKFHILEETKRELATIHKYLGPPRLADESVIPSDDANGVDGEASQSESWFKRQSQERADAAAGARTKSHKETMAEEKIFGV